MIMPKKKTSTKIKDLLKTLIKDFGPRCETYVYNCPVCAVWLAYDILYDLHAIKEQLKLPTPTGAGEEVKEQL